jgi:3-oxoacyl-[acyl-carrier protein] reductase
MDETLGRDDCEFRDRSVVITGAAGIYGGQFARRFARLGARVFLTDRNGEALDRLKADLGAPDRVETHAADLTSNGDLAELCDRAMERTGAPDVVINNAGIYPFGGLFDTDLDTFDRIFDVNVRAGFELTRRFSAGMIAAGKGGAVLFVGSGAARVLRTNGLAYCASKRALEWLMKGIALELGPHGIRVNMIEPGFWVGSAVTSHPEDYVAATVAQIPLRRLPDAEDAADTAVFLCSTAAKYITGVSVPVDGGVSIPHRRTN